MTAPHPDQFAAMQLVIGTVVRCGFNDGARDEALCLWIDIGDAGILQSSAKITEIYESDDLVGRQVVAAAGFDPIRVGGFRSDVLVIGGLTYDDVVLLAPDRSVPPGTRVA